MLEARERQQADLRDGSYREIVLPLADSQPGHLTAPVETSDLRWEVQIERANYPFMATRGSFQRRSPQAPQPEQRTHAVQ